MSTINPFGKLKVEREESSDEDFKEVKDTKIVKNQESKKKKKFVLKKKKMKKKKKKRKIYQKMKKDLKK